MTITNTIEKTKISGGNVNKSAKEFNKINNSKGEGLVKWLYPGAPNNHKMSEISSTKAGEKEEQDEMSAKTSSNSSSIATGSVNGGDIGATESAEGMDKDKSDAGSVDELPVDENKGTMEGVTEDISQKVTASANYLGSMFSSAWTKTAQTANDATANSTTFLSSAFTKVAAVGSDKTSPKDEEQPKVENGKENSGSSSTGNNQENSSSSNSSSNMMSASSLFNSAFSTLGFSSGTTTTTEDQQPEQKDPNNKEAAQADESLVGNFVGLGNITTTAWSTISKVAGDASNTIKEKVGTKNIISEFNKEQESFIKSKGGAHGEVGVAPWVGYQGEEELKSKILSLSQDKRNFIRAPPSGVTFEFDYSVVSPTAMALLQEDPNLKKMRYELVPKAVKEDEFWRNYFYRVNLIKQSFELKDLEKDGSSGAKNVKGSESGAKIDKKEITDIPDDVELSQEADDEFVSDAYQASTSDIAEVDESMKKLGVVQGEKAEAWEAELEGELNEFEVVTSGGKDENPEWENQIQEMLEEEEENIK